MNRLPADAYLNLDTIAPSYFTIGRFFLSVAPIPSGLLKNYVLYLPCTSYINRNRYNTLSTLNNFINDFVYSLTKICIIVAREKKSEIHK